MDHMDSWSCMQWWRTNRNFTKLHQGTWQFKHEPSCRVRAYRFRLVAFWISFRADKKNLWLEASGCKHQTAIVCLRPKRESYVPRFYWWYTPRRVQSWRLRKGDDNRKHSNIFYLQGHSLHVPPFRRLSMVFQCSFILFFIFLACKVCWNSALSVQTTGPIGAEAYELNRQPTSKTPMLHSKRRFQHSRVQ